MNAGDRSYFLSVLQSYKSHTREGINHFARKTTFPEMGGVSKLEMTEHEKEEIEGINKAAEDLLYYIDRLQKYLISQEREYFKDWYK